MEYQVTLYAHTGFNRGNLPSSVDALNGADTATFLSLNLLQERGIASVRIDATWDQVCDADYCKLQGTRTSWYIVDGVTMLNEHTAELSLMMDPIMTAGGVRNLTLLDGWVKRAHTRNDKMYGNLLAEPWTPSEPLKLSKPHEHTLTKGGYKNIMGLTINPVAIRNTARVYDELKRKDSGEDAPYEPTGESVVVPSVATVLLTSTTECGGYKYELPCTALYDMTSYDINENETEGEELASMKRAVSDMWSLGLSDAVSCNYLVPSDLVSVVKYGVEFQAGDPDVIHLGQLWIQNRLLVLNNNGEYEVLKNQHDLSLHRQRDSVEGATIKVLKGSTTRVPITDLPFKYGNVKNNKAMALWNEYMISETTSGDMAVYSAPDLDNGLTYPIWIVDIDPAPTGRPYYRPEMYLGEKTILLQESVSGSQWLNQPVAYGGVSASKVSEALWNVKRGHEMAYQQGVHDRTLGQANWNMAWTALHGIAGIAGGVGAVKDGDVIGGIASAVNSGVNIAQGISDTVYTHKNVNANLDKFKWDMGDKTLDLMTQNRVVAPTVTFAQSATMQCYRGAGFYMWHRTLSGNDLKRFDDFLSAYGYADDRKLESADFTSRMYHNYIKATSVNVVAPDIPWYICDMIHDLCQQGVRLWHVLPSANKEHLYNNPMKGG